jgi:radical SAM superfamily enzyme YgiQ (UPF0313 family)
MRILYLPSSLSQQRQFEKKNVHIYPVLLAMQAQYYRNLGHEVQWGYPFPIAINTGSWDKIIEQPENLPFLSLPHPDRVFTNAKSYTSGNYKYLPGTHILSASGCPHARCSFCVENGKPYEIRPVDDVISEIEECKAQNYKEIFDDSATFPQGEWLNDFTKKIAKLNMHFSCNMRIDSNVDYRSLFNAGFRMLLYGVESANQVTLDKINKGVKVEDIIPTLKKASEAGLEPHICVIFGHPNETDKDALNTLALTHYLLRKGYAKTAQASFYTLPAGQEKGNEAQRKYVKKIYEAAYYPDFWWNKIKEIKTMEDIRYMLRGIKSFYNNG